MTGKNKRKNYLITKSIKINKLQSENWNPKYIRRLLTFSQEDQIKILFKI